MKNILLIISAVVLYQCSSKPSDNSSITDILSAQVELYTTTETQSPLFLPVAMKYDSLPVENSLNIYIDNAKKYQTIDGFGAAITGSTCYNLLKMSPENRHQLLSETFDVEKGMGYNFIRISIGCSDFSMDEFTWCDTPGIENFDVHELDRRDLFPILAEILEINPNIKIMGSPWTPPRWMKIESLANPVAYNSWTSGQLNPKHYQDYATYFVRWIETMEEEGFPIYAITIQNEPLNRGNSASLFMTWQEQRDFVKRALGPKFKSAGLKTKIIIYDHNYDYDSHKEDCKDQIGYPTKIYEDYDASQYIDGAAFHAYGGEKAEMLHVHQANPDKTLYFTEMSIGMWGSGYTFKNDFMWNMREIAIGTLNNFSKGIMMWNFLLDDKFGPYRPGGCDICVGCIDISTKDYATLRKNSHYYTMAHLSKVIKPNAQRIDCNANPKPGIYCVAAENTDKSIGFVIQNDTQQQEKITIRSNDKNITCNLLPKSVNSLRFNKQN